MTNTSGLVGAILAIAGMIAAIGGISANEFKPVLIGFVLLAGAGIFALLSIAARKGGMKNQRQLEQKAMHELEL